MDTQQEADDAWQWASSLNPKQLHWCMTCVASDVKDGWFSPAETKALLQVVVLKLATLI